MDLGQVIHAQWAADETLNGLLPATKVMTGLYFASDPGYPYGTITLPGGPPGGWSNDAAKLNQVTVVVAVYHDHGSYDACKAIADRVVDLFDKTDFALTGSDKCLSIRAGEPQEIQDQDSGDWTFVVTLECSVYQGA